MEKFLGKPRRFMGVDVIVVIAFSLLSGVFSLLPLPVGSNTISVSTGSDAGDRIPQMIVGFKPGTAGAGGYDAMNRVAARYGVSLRKVRILATGATLVAFSKPMDKAGFGSFRAEALGTRTADYLDADIRIQRALTPNDPGYPQQWEFTEANGMRIPGAWNVSTGSGAKVAVLDTGITSHPDLNANILPGYDFITSATTARDGNGRDSNPQDQGDWHAAGECGSSSASNSSWHGTHVTGTVAAVTANSTGVASVAPSAKVVPVRVLGKCGGALSDIAEAIIWAAGGTVTGIPANPNPASVINLSLGASGACSATYQNAINSAVGRGATVVVAAGNSAVNASNSQPANCANVVTVASSGRDGSLAYYSNYGTAVDLTAPGGDMRTSGGGILSTFNNGTTVPGEPAYAFNQGTSMAAPHVSGLAALMKAYKPALTPAQVESYLKQGTRPMPAGCSQGCGAGLSDANATMTLIK
ncbi:hypothetical protein BIU82_01340 [Arthrobacter sp. SW1]|uniref:S8 family peptidase n=1 Tax=Arthrobacter sp. SW1 TaxID=1920889 RepID=UPI000877C585|nr:S8 family peptidase [Arthrobacter sp. SW1]OFI39726.1 hypothetical protein BIU82_01340 [Arthrobacter sp. SW1]